MHLCTYDLTISLATKPQAFLKIHSDIISNFTMPNIWYRREHTRASKINYPIFLCLMFILSDVIALNW